jgi:hypothetical protein
MAEDSRVRYGLGSAQDAKNEIPRTVSAWELTPEVRTGFRTL